MVRHTSDASIGRRRTLNDPVDHFRLLPETASTFAARLDWLMLFLVATSVVLTLAVFAFVVYFGLRYRRRSEDEVPPRPQTSRWLEITAASGLLALFLAMFGWGAVLYVDSRRPPLDALEIDVVGKQWMWTVRHPGGQREINELHVPLGQPVRLNMISQDVIHSFGVPAFRIKQDVLPGSYTTQWFTATKTGEYHLFCQEYCGTDHSQMRGRVVVLSPKDYQAWLLSAPPDDTPERAGQKLMTTYGCVTCHGVLAPTFAGLFGSEARLSDGSTVRVDEAYLRESILYPARKIVAGYPPQMPTYAGQLNDEQVGQLIAYIKTLGPAVSGTPSDASTSATRPVDGVMPQRLPNMPPAQQPPSIGGRR